MLAHLLVLAARAGAPDAPALRAPADGATDLALAVELSVAVSDPDGDALTATFYGRPRVAPGEDFTLVALPDTQFYACGCSGGSTETFGVQTSWVVEQIDALNIAYVAQLGDCVENGDDEPDEWLVADAAFSYFEEGRSPYALPAGGLPYGIAVGNHDQSPMGDPEGTTTYYNSFFGSDRFAGTSWYGGHYGDNNDNHYDLFEAGGAAFIVIYFEYDTSPDPDVLAWADAVLSRYPERHAIVVSHYLLSSSGTFSTQGQSVYDALSDHEGLFLMLAGHVSAEARREDTALRTVHTLLSDYQSRSGGGDGWLRLLSFSPTAGTLSVSTWSPALGIGEEDEDSAFTLPWDPNPAGWQALGARAAVDGVAALTWEGLSADASYEWRVELSDGSETTAGGPWSFTTGAGGEPAETGDTSVVVDSGAGETAADSAGGADSGATGGLDTVPDAGDPMSAPKPTTCGCASGGEGASVLSLALGLAALGLSARGLSARGRARPRIG